MQAAAMLQTGTGRDACGMIRPRTVRARRQLGSGDVPDVPSCSDLCLAKGLDAECHARARRARDRADPAAERARRCSAPETASRRSTRSARARARPCRCRRTGSDQVCRLPHVRRDHRHRRHRRRSLTAARRSRSRTLEVCALPFDRMEALSRENVTFQHNLHRLLSREIARERAVMVLLGTMDAGAAPGRVPARPVAALPGARLFVVRVRAADDARGDRQLPRAEARNGQPAVLALSTRRPPAGAGARREAARPDLAEAAARQLRLAWRSALRQLVVRRQRPSDAPAARQRGARPPPRRDRSGETRGCARALGGSARRHDPRRCSRRTFRTCC